MDACGALMISGGKPILSIEPNKIRFDASSYHEVLSRPPSVPVWEFRERR